MNYELNIADLSPKQNFIIFFHYETKKYENIRAKDAVA